ncbi:hypothetical protein [Streptomyces tsukubensis]|uniref:Integral membrane protein n=1 Tax=Streptomyces tsukubensis TaxID=83656 RepID=A0A1V4A2R6_9ACTN|nr:hypothetical protein [Streptomyces tsukubensis]OON73035.1 hypothetical protein B1H18_28195 [Streptomyces tsukubensis]
MTVRIFCAAAALLSLGMLAWITMLRLAIVTRARRHWGLFWVSIVVVISCVALVVTEEGDEITSWRGAVGALGLVLGAVCFTGYYLYADIQHYRSPRPRFPGALFPPTPSPSPSPYGTTAPSSGYGRPPSNVAPRGPGPAPGHPAGPPQGAPVYAPAQHRPGRIDQVRAELDELSDYLRSQEQGGTGRPPAQRQQPPAPHGQQSPQHSPHQQGQPPHPQGQRSSQQQPPHPTDPPGPEYPHTHGWSTDGDTR